jgi:hypothetical protein
MTRPTESLLGAILARPVPYTDWTGPLGAALVLIGLRLWGGA